jgi:hypothetical protein
VFYILQFPRWVQKKAQYIEYDLYLLTLVKLVHFQVHTSITSIMPLQKGLLVQSWGHEYNLSKFLIPRLPLNFSSLVWP